VSLSGLQEIAVEVFAPAQQGNGATYEAAPCQRFLLRSGASFAWSSVLRLPGPTEVVFSLESQLTAESPINPRTVEHLASEISAPLAALRIVRNHAARN